MRPPHSHNEVGIQWIERPGRCGLAADVGCVAGPGPSSMQQQQLQQQQQQQHLVFNLPPLQGRTVVRMPLPFASMGLSSSSQQQPVPQLVGNTALRQKEAQKDAPQDRILISEVGPCERA